MLKRPNPGPEPRLTSWIQISNTGVAYFSGTCSVCVGDFFNAFLSLFLSAQLYLLVYYNSKF